MPRRRRTYRLSPLARNDLEQIWLYTFERWSVKQADRYHEEVISAIEGLARGEKSGRPVGIREGYFKYAVGTHFIFFKATALHLDVMRILHQRMDIDRRF